MATNARMVYYTGRVQGVGFRATAEYLARDHAVTGWVKNLKDGRVQLLVEGSEEAIQEFLAALHKRLGRYIVKYESEDLPATGTFQSFAVTY